MSVSELQLPWAKLPGWCLTIAVVGNLDKQSGALPLRINLSLTRVTDSHVCRPTHGSRPPEMDVDCRRRRLANACRHDIYIDRV
jgi:hypothetical protein